MEFQKTVETPAGSVALDYAGIVWLTSEGEINAAGARSLYEDRTRIGCADRKQRLIVDLRKNPKPNKEARDFADSDEVVGITAAMALLTNSAISRMVGNFFLGFNRASFPTRMFSSEADARRWLESF